MKIPKKVLIPRVLKQIAQKIKKQNGVAILVGGSLRDALWNLPVKDYDVEVYGIPTLKDLKKIVDKFGALNEVGKSFSVLKLKTKNLEIDFSFPRSDIKIASGHKGFKVTPNPNLDYHTAASRRDFTINSMGLNILSQEFLDPFNGKKDLDQKILRHIGPAFTEDPLRVYRACQFAARFGLKIHPKTIQLCQNVNLSDLPKERVFDELEKMLLKSQKPSLGLKAMADLKVINALPELKHLYENKKSWQHTQKIVNKMAKSLTPSTPNAISLMLVALCMDLDKSLKPFLKRITQNKKVIQSVIKLIQNTQKILKEKNISDATLKKIALQTPIKELILCLKVNNNNRGKWLQKKAKSIPLTPRNLKPMLKGRHLVAIGIKPGPKMGQILEEVYNLQLEGKITNLKEGLAWLKKYKVD